MRDMQPRSERPPPLENRERPTQMVKPQTSVVWGRERRLHVQIIDFVAGVNGVAFNAGDSD